MGVNKMFETYCIKKGENARRTLYEGPSPAAAKRAAARWLGYKRVASAYTYTSPTSDGHYGVFYCRRRDAARNDFDVAVIVEMTP